jgi:hypothetical protein
MPCSPWRWASAAWIIRGMQRSNGLPFEPTDLAQASCRASHGLSRPR